MRQYVLVVLFSLFFFGSASAGIRPSEIQSEKNGTTAKIVVERTATVSWYNHGKKTANGEKFNPNGFTVAHKTLPFGTIVKFTNPENDKVVYARVNDRGPYIRGREFDLTQHCANILGVGNKGILKLKIQIIKWS